MEQLCTITKTLTGRYKISFFNPHFYREIINDSFPTCDLPYRDKLAVYEKCFDKLDRNYDEDSRHRAKMTVIDYGENNEWSYFTTITFSSRKINREDKTLLYLKVRKAFDNYKQRFDKDVRYVLCPEYHEDGKHIHFHGLVYLTHPLPEDNPDISRHWCKKTKKYYYRSAFFFNKFGAFRFDPISSSALYASCYISKYITKVQEKIFGCRYICSKGLKRSEKVAYFEDYKQTENVKRSLLLSCTPDGAPLVNSPVVKTKFATTYVLDETQFQIFNFCYGGIL